MYKSKFPSIYTILKYMKIQNNNLHLVLKKNYECYLQKKIRLLILIEHNLTKKPRKCDKIVFTRLPYAHIACPCQTV